jgi:hypothetical protein
MPLNVTFHPVVRVVVVVDEDEDEPEPVVGGDVGGGFGGS